MNKKLFILFICFLTVPIALAEDWHRVHNNKSDLKTYVDIDSLYNKSKDTIEYKIKYEDLNKNSTKILYAESNCKKNLAAVKNSKKDNLELKTFTKESAISFMHNYMCSIEEQNKSIDWTSYMKDVEARIKSNWFPPKSDSTKTVVITFVIGRSGSLISQKITQSSGMPMADKAASDAIKYSSPFKPLPSQYTKQSIPIEFKFDYNVIYGKN